MSDLVEDLVGQLGAERDDEFGGLALVSLVVDDVQSGQRLDVVERHLLEQCRQQHALFRSRMNGFHDPPVTLRLPDLNQQFNAFMDYLLHRLFVVLHSRSSVCSQQFMQPKRSSAYRVNHLHICFHSRSQWDNYRLFGARGQKQ